METGAFVETLSKLSSDENISPHEAAKLATSLSEFLQSGLGIDSSQFFRKVDWESLGQSPIPVTSLVSTPINQDAPGFPHYWVYRSPKNGFPDATSTIPSKYFDNHVAAHTTHLENIEAGCDSYVKASTGAGDPRYQNIVTANLFLPDLMRGLMVVAHEPVHNLIESIENIKGQGYVFNEALITYLGIKALVLFAQEVLDPQADPVSGFVKYYADYFEFVQIFRRLSYLKLKEVYNRDAVARGETEDRSAEAQETLEMIRRITGLVTGITDRKKLEEINNAVIYSDFAYSGSIVVSEFFTMKAIDVKRFILDMPYREEVLPELIVYFNEHIDSPPENLEQQWQDLCKITT